MKNPFCSVCEIFSLWCRMIKGQDKADLPAWTAERVDLSLPAYCCSHVTLAKVYFSFPYVTSQVSSQNFTFFLGRHQTPPQTMFKFKNTTLVVWESLSAFIAKKYLKILENFENLEFLTSRTYLRMKKRVGIFTLF